MFGCLILDVCKSWCRNLLLINIRWHSFLSIIPPTAKENKANLGIPTEYDLPLMDGITSHYKPRYWRDGCNNVGIAGLILFDEHPIFEQKIAMLPVGYRPITSRQFALAMAVPPHTSIYGWIEVNGTIRLASVNYSEDVKRNSSFAFIVPPFYAAF